MGTAGTALAEAKERRHRATLSAAQNAIALLQRQDDTVIFASVAKQAGVSRAWLYREPSIRELISLARSSTDRPIIVRSPQRASADSLRQMIDSLRTDLCASSTRTTPSANNSLESWENNGRTAPVSG